MDKQHNSANPTKKVAIADNKNLTDIAQYVKGGQSGHKRSIPPLDPVSYTHLTLPTKA